VTSPLGAIVVGGSLGGLSTALVLADLGADVLVFERSGTELEQRGAGIGFLPESSRYLAERGGVDLDTISTVTHHVRYLDRAGAVTHDQHHTYRFSSWNAVYRGLLACFGRERYRLGHEVVDITEPADRAAGPVEVRVADGTRHRADVVVCADGVGSTFRDRWLPDARRRYAGYVAWRGMVPEVDVPADVATALGDAITYHVYANSHILVYPIPGLDGSVAPGERLLNFVWYRNYLDDGDLRDVLTDRDGTAREISLPPGAARDDHLAELRATAVARLPAPIATVVTSVEQPFLQVVYDVEVSRMAFGRRCLVGDAAWVARPHAAAGTAKAAADAWALGDALAGVVSGHTTVADALRAWEPGQMELGRQLLERTRRIGAHSQVHGTWDPDDPELVFGLRGPGR
jgi:2,6-dihydroxypyridine 3-monooxygenase